ncbi:hypothetical protein J7J81_01690, partial [bacterium]|nr:hypothetical protein [bacterium]
TKPNETRTVTRASQEGITFTQDGTTYICQGGAPVVYSPNNNNNNNNSGSSAISYFIGGGGGAVNNNEARLEKIRHGDADGNGIVDIKDFNLLMINWGKKSNNSSSDFNRDGKVDVFDFNILMVNWGKRV